MADLTDYLKHVLADKADRSRFPAKRANSSKAQNANIQSAKPQHTVQPNSAQRTGSQAAAVSRTASDPGNQTAAAIRTASEPGNQAAAGGGTASEPDNQAAAVGETASETGNQAAAAIRTASEPDNQAAAAGRTAMDSTDEKDREKKPDLIYYLRRAVADKASDLFIVAGGKVSEKVDKVLLPISEENVMPRDAERLITEFYTCAKRSMDRYYEKGDDDFSLSIPGLARFRINTYRQRGSMAAVARIVIFDIPDWRGLHIPAQVMELSSATHGMVLVTGTAGSGKSTTQACIIDQINKTRGCHIITLEDPIEYLHRDRKSIVSQREIAIDSENYLTALRACLRQAPDVILLGEMRDHETIRTAMTAAETGHLLIATLHTQGAVNTIDRIIDSFPSGQQTQIRVQLSMVLHTVVSQQLLPGINGELVPAYEIMCMNNAIRSLIRESKSHQIDNVIAAGSAEGMLSMDQSILTLYQERKITKETALEFAEHPDQLLRRMGN